MSSGRRPSTEALGTRDRAAAAADFAASSLESARRRLGGRARPPSARALGSLVEGTRRDAEPHAGVVLWASEHHCDVWFDDGVPRRVAADSIRPSPGPTPEPLVAVAADIRVFDALREGERVRWDRSIGVAEGYIAEKCRWGAIVVTEAGKVLAVGFRRLWPASVHTMA